jgi:UrcA family protein
MSFKSTITALSAVAAIAMAAAASSATAATPSTDDVSVKVSYEGIDLNSNAGHKIMLARITQAARQICGVRPAKWMFDASRAYDGCMTSVTDRALGQLDSAKLAANVHKGRPANVTLASGQ